MSLYFDLHISLLSFAPSLGLIGLFQTWNDKYLTWDPAEYGGVESLRVDSDDIWLPDVMLYNT